MKNLAILFFISWISVIGVIDAQQIDEEFYSNTQMYDNSASNDFIIISIDKFSYLPGERYEIKGLVDDPKKGARIFIKIDDQWGNIIANMNIGISAQGFFTVKDVISTTVDPGEYNLYAKYNNQTIILPIIIESRIQNVVIKIPYNSYLKSSSQTFAPDILQVEEGTQITWRNEDVTAHTVVSGKEKFTKIFPDGHFNSGIFRPNKEFSIFLDEGTYTYFCRLHPWLVGFIQVTPSSQPIELPSEDEDELELATLHQGEDLDQWKLDLCDSCLGNLTLSSDRKQGESSIKINIEGTSLITSEQSSLQFNFEPINLIDYSFLQLWIKTKGSVTDPFDVGFVDINNNFKTFHQINPITQDWKIFNVPIRSVLANDETFTNPVTGFKILFPKGDQILNKKIEMLIDEVVIFKEKKSIEEQNLFINTKLRDYANGTTLFLSGYVKNIEAGPVVLKVQDPSNNSVFIDQVTPSEDGTFGLSIKLQGKYFKKEGIYTIKSQYGIKNHKAETQITVSSPLMVESSYNGYNIYKLGNLFYAFSELDQQFDFNRIITRFVDNNKIFNSGWQSESGVEVETMTDKLNQTSLKISWKGNRSAAYLNLSPLDWTDFNSVSFSVFGSNTNTPMRMQIRFNDQGGDDWVEYNWSDNFSGWRNLSFDLHTPTKISGIVDWGNVVQILIQPVKEHSFTLIFSDISFSSDSGTILFDDSSNELKQVIDSLPPVGPYLVEGRYYNFNIIFFGGKYYAIPQNEGSFEINRITQNDYSKTFSGSNKPDLKELIDEFINFPIPEAILKTIWEERNDLQTMFPEVEQGDFVNFRKWARELGWNEDPRLAPLVPAGLTPSYLELAPEQPTVTDELVSEQINTTQVDTPLVGTIRIIVIAIVIGIVGLIAFITIKKRISQPQQT